MADTPGECGAFQRDLNRLHKLANLSLVIDVQQRELQSPAYEQSNPMYQYRLEPGQLDISFAGKNPGDPGGHPVAHEPKKVNSILDGSRESITGRSRGMILLLYSALVRPICSAGYGSGLPRTRDT